MADGFLGRWSQRKQAVRDGHPLVEHEPAVATPCTTPGAPPALVPAPTARPPAPTLEDVQTLTSDDSFARFVTPEVPCEVRNAAMKKLFADPHYNLMDGLDIYIEDYSLPSPLPVAMLQQMVSAQFLKLADESDAPPENVPVAHNTVQSAPLPTPETDHDHTDMRLQPDHAAGPAGTGRELERGLDAAFEPVPPQSS